MCDQLVKCLKDAADCSIPCKGPGKQPCIAGWSQFVKPELQASQRWHKLWLDAGSPSAGVLFQLKKHCHRRYKYAVRRVRRRQEHIRCEKLAEALLQDSNRSVWSEVHRAVGRKKVLHLQLFIMLLGLSTLPICGPIVSSACTTPLTVLSLQNC